MSAMAAEKKVDYRVNDVDSASTSDGQIQVLEDGGGSDSPPRLLHRNFKARHIQMICLGGNLGSGLFIGTGKSLRYAGAPGMILAYLLVCSLCLSVMSTMSEATVLWPTSGSFIDHAARFLDPALGFALGICEWLAWMTIVAAEGAVFNIIIGYWTDAIPTPAAMAIFLVIVYAIHFMPSRWFAETEFITAAAKVVTIIVVLIVCLALLGGAGPTGTTHHAENYTELPLFPHGFKGFCSVIPMAAWGMGGQEIMGISAGEATMPRWDMPRAFKSLFARISVFFMGSVVLIGVLVHYDDPALLGTGNAGTSPFVIAMNNAGIRVLPDIVNAVILVGLVGIGSESLYISSRVLFAMADMKMLPAFVGRVDRKGRPRWALLITMVISVGLTYAGVSSTGGVVLGWFSSIGSTVSFMIWMSMAATNWAVHRAVAAQNDPAFSLPYALKIRFWPLGPAYLFVMTVVVFGLVIWTSTAPVGGDISVANFFETCIGVPIGIVCYVGYKLYFRTKLVRPEDADLVTGRRLLTEEDIAQLDAYYAQPMWKRVMSYFTF